MIQEEMFPIQRGKSIILNGQRIKAYDIRTITLEQFRMLIACGNDRHNNQMKAAEDNSHVIPLYYALIGNWRKGCSHTYIDSF